MMKTGDYRGTTIKPKTTLEKIDEVIALRIEGDRLVEAHTKGIQFRKKYESYTSQKKTENKWTVERPDIRYPVNFYSGVIYDRQRGQLYSFMTHKLQLCWPYTPCAMR